MTITLKTAQDIEGMRVACRLASEVLDYITPFVKPGVTTNELDKLCHDYMVDVQQCIPAPLNYAPGGYKPYPKSICTSINHQVCHGIPNDKPLKKGDSLNIDITTIKHGWHGDTSRMFHVGEASIAAKRLANLTYYAMWKGIEQVKPGAHLGDIGHAIQSFVEAQRCSVVRDFCGHGLGRIFHDNPNIVHFGKPGQGPELRAGMFFTIEPMVNLGKHSVSVLPDGWTAVTRDRSLSAQFEHSIGVTENGCEIFTLSPLGLDTPHTLSDPV